MSTSLRLPPELEADLKRLATAHDRSVHGEMLYALKQYVRSGVKDYIVAYEVLTRDRQTISDEMVVSAISEECATEYAAHVLDEKYEDSTLLECQVTGWRK